MATDTFSSPTMRARAALIRGLALVDDMERAWLRGRHDEVRRLATAAMREADAAQAAYDETWERAVPAPLAEPITAAATGPECACGCGAAEDHSAISESEARALDGNR